MTTVLKDSLGGNCKTVMIATMASETEHLEETISTARFAQRCSQLVNEVENTLHYKPKHLMGSRLRKMRRLTWIIMLRDLNLKSSNCSSKILSNTQMIVLGNLRTISCTLEQKKRGKKLKDF